MCIQTRACTILIRLQPNQNAKGFQYVDFIIKGGGGEGSRFLMLAIVVVVDNFFPKKRHLRCKRIQSSWKFSTVEVGVKMTAFPSPYLQLNGPFTHSGYLCWGPSYCFLTATTGPIQGVRCFIHFCVDCLQSTHSMQTPKFPRDDHWPN